MIGWVPYVLSAFIEEAGGPGARREVLLAAGFDAEEGFRINASYADAACRRLLDAACLHFGMSEDEAFEAFAPFFLRRSREMFPAFFAHRPCVRAFLLHQPEVHNTLAAGLAAGQRDSVARKFRVEPMEGGLRVFYRSANRLAGLYAAVARRLGEELGQPTSVRFEAGGPGEAECIMAIEVQGQTAQVAA